MILDKLLNFILGKITDTTPEKSLSNTSSHIELTKEQTEKQPEKQPEEQTKGKTMNIISKEEKIYNSKKAIVYTLDETVNRNTIVTLIKMFENESTEMSRCHISTYSESGSVSGCTFWNVEELEQLKSFPSPYMSFYIDFADRLSKKYSFSVDAHSNDIEVWVFTKSEKNL